MYHPKLRIAWSVAWGLAAVLFAALCVRSFWWCYGYSLPRMGRVVLVATSLRGDIMLCWSENPYDADGGYFTSCPANEYAGREYFSGRDYWFRFESGSQAFSIFLPMWVPIVMSVGLGVSPWLRWHFSLRTLLVATTLIAVGLGLFALAPK
jgi:hypothetical protein